MASEFITAETAKSWLEADEAVLIDVREAPEHAAARIEGAILNPLSGFDPASVPPHEGKKLILHCASGIRCGMAADQMAGAGYDETIYRLQGGIQAWHEAGYPVAFG